MKISLSNIKNVRLISPKNQEYKSYCKKIISEKNTNSSEKNTDQKMYVARWLEASIKSELLPFHCFSENRIIKWENVNSSRNMKSRYKEIDGVFNSSSTSVSIYEIKGSLSKSSIKSGIDQINDSRMLLSRVYKNIYSTLILADWRSIDSEFGCAELEEIDNLLSLNEFDVYRSLEKLQDSFSKSKICVILDESSIDKLVQKYGHPYNVINSEDAN